MWPSAVALARRISNAHTLKIGAALGLLGLPAPRIAVVSGDDVDRAVAAAHTAFGLDASETEAVVYGGTGKAARSWEAYDALVRTLRDAGLPNVTAAQLASVAATAAPA